MVVHHGGRTVVAPVVVIARMHRLIKVNFKINVHKNYHLKKIKKTFWSFKKVSSYSSFFSSFLVWYKLIVSRNTSILEEGKGLDYLHCYWPDSGLIQYVSLSKKDVDVHCNNLFLCCSRHQRCSSTPKFTSVQKQAHVPALQVVRMEAVLPFLCPFLYGFLGDGVNTNQYEDSIKCVNSFIDKAVFFFFFVNFGNLRLSIRLILENILIDSLTSVAFSISQKYHPKLLTVFIIGDSPILF